MSGAWGKHLPSTTFKPIVPSSPSSSPMSPIRPFTPEPLDLDGGNVPEYQLDTSTEYNPFDKAWVDRELVLLNKYNQIIFNKCHKSFTYTKEQAIDLVNSNRLKSTKEQEFIQCMVISVFNEHTDKKYKGVSHIHKLTGGIKDNLMIEQKPFAEGSIASTYRVKLKIDNEVTKQPFSVLKISKVHDSAESIHELTIGLALNSLRTPDKPFFPYFSYLYGGFICGDDISSICKTGFESLMYLQEFIDGRSYFDLITTLTYKDKCQIILQIAYALYVAYSSLKFIHNDLHVKNILVKKVNSTTLHLQDINYTLKNVSYIPVIIDYGQSLLNQEDDCLDINMLGDSLREEDKNGPTLEPCRNSLLDWIKNFILTKTTLKE